MLKFVQKGLPAKYGGGETRSAQQQQQGKEQLYIPRTEQQQKQYYSNKYVGRALWRHTLLICINLYSS